MKATLTTTSLLLLLSSMAQSQEEQNRYAVTAAPLRVDRLDMLEVWQQIISYVQDIPLL